MEVMLLGMVTLVRLEHPSKASSPMELTLPGMVTARQVGTPLERIGPDGGDAAGDGHAPQTGTTIERRISDGRDAVGDGHARQAGNPLKRRLPNGCDRAIDPSQSRGDREDATRTAVTAYRDGGAVHGERKTSQDIGAACRRRVVVCNRHDLVRGRYPSAHRVEGNRVAAHRQAGNRDAVGLPNPSVHLPLRPGADRPGGSKRNLQ